MKLEEWLIFCVFPIIILMALLSIWKLKDLLVGSRKNKKLSSYVLKRETSLISSFVALKKRKKR